MDRLFLDANVLFSAAYHAESRLLKFWELPRVMFLSSTYAYEEASRNLARDTQLKRLKKLGSTLKLIPSEQDHNDLPAGIILPDKDKPILSAALAGKADYLITGDYKDFGRYFKKRVGSLVVLPPSAFFDLIRTPR